MPFLHGSKAHKPLSRHSPAKKWLPLSVPMENKRKRIVKSFNIIEERMLFVKKWKKNYFV